MKRKFKHKYLHLTAVASRTQNSINYLITIDDNDKAQPYWIIANENIENSTDWLEVKEEPKKEYPKWILKFLDKTKCNYFSDGYYDGNPELKAYKRSHHTFDYNKWVRVNMEQGNTIYEVKNSKGEVFKVGDVCVPFYGYEGYGERIKSFSINSGIICSQWDNINRHGNNIEYIPKVVKPEPKTYTVPEDYCKTNINLKTPYSWHKLYELQLAENKNLKKCWRDAIQSNNEYLIENVKLKTQIDASVLHIGILTDLLNKK